MCFRTFEQKRQKRLRNIDHTPQIHVENSLNVFNIQIIDANKLLYDSSIVDNTIHSAMRLNNGCRQGKNDFSVSNVSNMR